MPPGAQAPSLMAASEESPLPDPISRKERPASVDLSSMAAKARCESLTRSSVTRFKYAFQFLPKGNRKSSWQVEYDECGAR